ncbi:MAG: hypothetical protein WC465_05125 [Patescibacteria group bacterium]
MFNESRDILNWLLGISVLLVASWLSWLLYQMGRTLKNVNKTLEGIQKIVDGIQHGLETLHEKTSHLATYFGLVLKLGEQILNMIKNKASERQARQSSRSERTNKNKS